jgi:hypothetical protein
MGILLLEGVKTISDSIVDGLRLSNYTQQLRSTGIFFILTLLILLPIISHTPLQTSNPPLQNSSQTNKQFRLGTNFESLDRDMVWNRTYSFSPYDRGYAITECLTGGFALFGETEDSQRQTDLLLIRVDAEGNVLWNSTFGTAEYEGGADFVECLDGGFVLLGNRWGEMFLIRTNSFGHLQWNQSLDSRTGPFGTSIVRCQSGGFAVLCGDYHQTLLLRLDEEGVPLWNKTYDSRPFWSCDTFVECQDGGFAFMGTFPGYVTPPAVMLFRTDTVGNMLWNHTFEFRGYSWGFGLVECEDGGFAFTGTIHDWSILADYLYLVRTDHLGVLIWNNTYGDGCGNSVLQMNSGELVITGFIVGVIASYDDVVFHVVNSSGHVLVDWEIGGAYAQLGNSIIECRDGGFAIIGETYDEADFSNVLLIRIPREAVLNSLQILQWVGVVIVLPILVSVIIAIVTIWLFRSKKVTIHQEEQS